MGILVTGVISSGKLDGSMFLSSKITGNDEHVQNFCYSQQILLNLFYCLLSG